MLPKTWREQLPWANRLLERFDRYPRLRKVITSCVGGLVLVIGIIMIVTPGPAVVFIPAGLAILATEFSWAKRALTRLKWFLRKSIRQWKDRNTRH